MLLGMHVKGSNKLCEPQIAFYQQNHGGHFAISSYPAIIKHQQRWSKCKQRIPQTTQILLIPTSMLQYQVRTTKHVTLKDFKVYSDNTHMPVESTCVYHFPSLNRYIITNLEYPSASWCLIDIKRWMVLFLTTSLSKRQCPILAGIIKFFSKNGTIR